MKYAPIFRLAAEKYLTPPEKIRSWESGQQHSNYSCVAVDSAIRDLVDDPKDWTEVRRICQHIMQQMGLDLGLPAAFDAAMEESGYNIPSLEERQLMRFDWLQLVAAVVEDAE